MPSDEDWEELDPDMMMRSERKHEWISEPKYKRMFDDIEDALQGVMGSGRYEWVDRRVFDQVFDRSTLLALHKLMEQGEIATIDYPIARGKEAHVFRATSASGPMAAINSRFPQGMRPMRLPSVRCWVGAMDGRLGGRSLRLLVSCPSHVFTIGTTSFPT